MLNDRVVWLTARSNVQTDPSIVEISNFLSKHECDQLIALSSQRLEKSKTISKDGTLTIDSTRTSEGMSFSVGENNLIKTIEKRIEDLTGWPVQKGEPLQVLKYDVNQEYKSHYDYFENLPTNQLQRVATLIIYLNKPEDGGETIFPNMNLSITPETGKGLFFKYVNIPSPNSLHAGSPVIRGVKYIATKWFIL
ncbi:MAG: 2OG-Fe(II) oxygenase [Culicoidibacterales bacterium]